jgi:nucleoside diphosphate kinase
MQAEELSYVILTPYSMRKSRTGGIISRLISRTGLDVVAARMFAPSQELVKRYADTIVTETDPRHRATQELLRKYVAKNFTGTVNGQRPRVMLLVFPRAGCNPKTVETVGHIVNERTSGETIRDTFGDYITTSSGEVTYFEPAVLTAIDSTACGNDLKLWADYSDIDGGILDKVLTYRQARTSRRRSSSSSRTTSASRTSAPAASSTSSHAQASRSSGSKCTA